jgi:hypothetical protein
MTMATNPPPVKISTRLWSDEVRLAEGDDPIPPYDPAYKFNNGKEFVEKAHYLNATEGYDDE